MTNGILGSPFAGAGAAASVLFSAEGFGVSLQAQEQANARGKPDKKKKASKKDPCKSIEKLIKDQRKEIDETAAARDAEAAARNAQEVARANALKDFWWVIGLGGGIATAVKSAQALSDDSHPFEKLEALQGKCMDAKKSEALENLENYARVYYECRQEAYKGSETNTLEKFANRFSDKGSLLIVAFFLLQFILQQKTMRNMDRGIEETDHRIQSHDKRLRELDNQLNDLQAELDGCREERDRDQNRNHVPRSSESNRAANPGSSSASAADLLRKLLMTPAVDQPAPGPRPFPNNYWSAAPEPSFSARALDAVGNACKEVRHFINNPEPLVDIETPAGVATLIKMLIALDTFGASLVIPTGGLGTGSGTGIGGESPVVPEPLGNGAGPQALPEAACIMPPPPNLAPPEFVAPKHSVDKANSATPLTVSDIVLPPVIFYKGKLLYQTSAQADGYVSAFPEADNKFFHTGDMKGASVYTDGQDFYIPITRNDAFWKMNYGGFKQVALPDDKREFFYNQQFDSSKPLLASDKRTLNLAELNAKLALPASDPRHKAITVFVYDGKDAGTELTRIDEAADVTKH